MSRGPRRRGLLVVAAVAGSVLVACGAVGEGTVVGKAGPAAAHHACRAGGTVTGPVAVPVWGACGAPDCWRLVVRGSDGTTSEACVSRAEYDRTPLGAFRHGRTDR